MTSLPSPEFFAAHVRNWPEPFVCITTINGMTTGSLSYKEGWVTREQWVLACHERLEKVRPVRMRAADDPSEG